MTDSPIVKPGFYGWKNVILLFIIYMSVFGFVFYGYSIIFPAMIKSLGWNRGTASIAHTINVLLTGFVVPLIAVSINRIGAKKTITIGLMVVLAGLLMLGTITSKMWQWIILWGFVVSFGFAFCGGLPIQIVLMYWFNINRATAIGIVMTGAALGGFLAQHFYTWLMGIANTWRAGWLNGAVFAFIGLLFSLLVINKPADAGQFPDGLSPEKIKAKEEKQGIRKRPYRTSTSWELNEALKTPTLWFIVIVIIGHIMPLFLVTSHGVLHLMDRGFSQLQAASILGFIILGGGIARFPVGWLGDRIEPRWILTVTLGIMLVMFLGIWKLSNPKIMIAAGMIYGFCYGSQLIMFPTIIGNYYGPERFAGINGVIGPILIAFGAVIPFGGGYIFESTGSYDLAFIALSIFLCISFFISFWLAPPLIREKP